MLEMEIPVKIVTKLVVHSKGLVAVLVLLCLKAFFARESELLPSRQLLFSEMGFSFYPTGTKILGFYSHVSVVYFSSLVKALSSST